VKLGLVASLARPSGNATGVNFFIAKATGTDDTQIFYLSGSDQTRVIFNTELCYIQIGITPPAIGLGL